MQGWIKLHRKLIEWEWFHCPDVAHLFIYLLLKANHKDGSWQGIPIAAGQLLTGRKRLSDETGLSQQKIRTCLNKLKSTSDITIKSTSRFSLITVCNYSTYQLKDKDVNQHPNQQPNQQLTSDQPTINQQLTTNKNDNNTRSNITHTATDEILGFFDNSKFSLDDCKNAAFKAGLSDEEAESMFHHFNSQGWTKTNGRPITDINSAMVNWKNYKPSFQQKEKANEPGGLSLANRIR